MASSLLRTNTFTTIMFTILMFTTIFAPTLVLSSSHHRSLSRRSRAPALGHVADDEQRRRLRNKRTDYHDDDDVVVGRDSGSSKENVQDEVCVHVFFCSFFRRRLARSVRIEDLSRFHVSIDFVCL